MVNIDKICSTVKMSIGPPSVGQSAESHSQERQLEAGPDALLDYATPGNFHWCIGF
jgi:hypothetical protein